MVKNTKAKGQRIERKAEEWLQERGYLTQRQNNHRFGDNDYFNWFDILAVPTPEADLSDLAFDDAATRPPEDEPNYPTPPAKNVLAQVKANTASGVRSCEDWIVDNLGYDVEIMGRKMFPETEFLYMVWHDREGWRILRFNYFDERFKVVLDDR